MNPKQYKRLRFLVLVRRVMEWHQADFAYLAAWPPLREQMEWGLGWRAADRGPGWIDQQG